MFTVVCVEDERSIRNSYKRILRKLKAKVVLFNSADDAITELAQGNVEFDILVTDLNTESEYNGYDLIARVKQMNPSIPCILISADPQEFSEIATPDCVLEKPVELDVLIRTFQDYISCLS